MLIVHLFVSYAHVNLCHFFSSSWCQGLAATSACGSSWTFLLTFFGELVFLQIQTSFYFQLREKFKCIEYRDKDEDQLKTSHEIRKSEKIFFQFQIPGLNPVSI